MDSASHRTPSGEAVVSVRTYAVVFVVLAALTISTYVAAFAPLGAGNLAVGLAIAAAKAILIAVYFMHAKYGPTAVRAVIGAGLLWLGVMLVLTMSDYLTRG